MRFIAPKFIVGVAQRKGECRLLSMCSTYKHSIKHLKYLFEVTEGKDNTHTHTHTL